MLRVAIVGCGKIANDHASQIRRIKGCEIVGVCDREPLMARQLAERFGVKQCFSDLEQLLREARPDVVHLTTSGEPLRNCQAAVSNRAVMSMLKSLSRYMSRTPEN